MADADEAVCGSVCRPPVVGHLEYSSVTVAFGTYKSNHITQFSNSNRWKNTLETWKKIVLSYVIYLPNRHR